MVEDLQLVIADNIPLRDAVFETLREAILKGVLPPGQHLMEMQLAYQLGVSRTPVREAIRMLELEGLVNMVPRKGARVAAISEKSLCDVLEVRRALEELSVRLACTRMERDDLEKLDSINQQFIRACQSDDVVQIARIDESFHAVIYEAADNVKLLQLLNQMQNQMYRYRIEYIKMKDRRQILVEEHKKIIHSLARRDVDAATEATRTHIAHQEQYVMSVIQGNR
ncbi:MAG: GntR family transcriptional regulator [Lachnospiraceae bacterium]|nr:GntR family transcriptional regulator [Lachnospiraceae bacterium]MDY4969705.1 GntR family transcriptional regulator [Lachnospiraceae bacterium]